MLTILQGNCLEKLRELPDASVQCCVTSPPYWGLRDYGLPPSVFGGRPDCQHDWTEVVTVNSRGNDDTAGEKRRTNQGSEGWRNAPRKSGTCRHCGAWLGQLGLEPTPEMFVDHLVEIFREVRRVLREDGTLWLNLGDSYSGSGRGTGDVKSENKGNGNSRGVADDRGSSRGTNRTRLANGRGDSPAVQRNKEPVIPDMRGSQLPAGIHESARPAGQIGRAWVPPPPGLKNKDLVGIPWMAAFALRRDGWYLRSGIPWLKRSCMPESVTDRPTTALEYVFLLSKTDDYYFDKDAVSMPLAGSSAVRLAQDVESQDVESQDGSTRANGGGKSNGTMKAVASGKWSGAAPHASGKRLIDGVKEARLNGGDHDNPFGARRNIRNTDWFMQSLSGLIGNEDGDPLAFIVNPQGYKDAHFATWPERLVRPMILAGCPQGGVVLDLFGGSGTTGKVALELGRQAILCELNPEYVKLIRQRCETTVGLAL